MRFQVQARCVHVLKFISVRGREVWPVDVVVKLIDHDSRGREISGIAEKDFRATLQLFDSSRIYDSKDIEVEAGSSCFVTQLSFSGKRKCIHYANEKLCVSAEGNLECVVEEAEQKCEPLKGLDYVFFVPQVIENSRLWNTMFITVGALGGAGLSWANATGVKKPVAEGLACSADQLTGFDRLIAVTFDEFCKVGLFRVGVVIISVALVAALVERILEVLVSAYRKPRRDILDALVVEAERASRVDRKNDIMRSRLLQAETDVISFKSDTRVRSLSVGFLLGCSAAYVGDIRLLQQLVEVPSAALALANTLVIGFMVAGGAEPLHSIVKGIMKSLGNVRRWRP